MAETLVGHLAVEKVGAKAVMWDDLMLELMSVVMMAGLKVAWKVVGMVDNLADSSVHLMAGKMAVL